MRFACRKTLVKAGYSVETFDNGASGLEGVARLKPDLLLVDLKMPGLTGTEVISRVRELDPDLVVVVITGYATIDTAVGAMQCGAYDFLPKPFSPDELRIIVARALERRRFVLERKRCEVERELLKRRFVTFVSHQLQTPLVAVHQYLDLLRQFGDAPERREWFERCLCRVREMQTLIKDWLTLARLEGGGLSKQRMRVDLGAAAGAVVSAVSELAAASQVQVESTAGQVFVAADPGCIAVLLDNLVVNGIKYNRPGGSVWISAEVDKGEVLLSVRDTGIGIPRQYRQLLFEEFFRVEQDGAPGRQGSGLGLSIVKRIVDELGGAIEVESEEGAGSVFRLRLPAWRE
jgi:signal transduction histidine kinase